MTIHRAEDPRADLADTLRALTRLWGLSARELALASGVSRATAQGRLSGAGAPPRSDELQAYARFFGVPMELLFLPAEKAVVRAIEEYDFLARSPKSGGPDGGAAGYAPGDSNPEPSGSGFQVLAAAA